MADDKDTTIDGADGVNGVDGEPATAPPVALNSMTPSSADIDLQPLLPPLPYSLRDHKKNICLVWSLFALDSAILPVALFYILWYASSLQPAYIFAVTTGVFGLISGIEWATRTWLLFKRENLRPLGADDTRWLHRFDFFHITYTVGYTLVIAELIIGAAPNDPIIRLCSMPAPSFVIFFGSELLIFSIMSSLHAKTPFRISSVAKGKLTRPLIYTIIEDVIAVDTGAGRNYREALNNRYEASPLFRRMLSRLNWFWGVSALVVGFGTVAAIWVQQIPEYIAYGVGWAVPPVWAGTWTIITIKWVQSSLRYEKTEWRKTNRV